MINFLRHEFLAFIEFPQAFTTVVKVEEDAFVAFGSEM